MNLTINGNGVDVDYDPPPFLQLTVTNISTVHNNSSDSNSLSGRGSGRGSGNDGNHNTTQPPAIIIFQSDKNFVPPEIFWSKWFQNKRNEFLQGPQWWDGTPGLNYPLLSSSFSGFNYDTQFHKLNDNKSYSYSGIQRNFLFLPSPHTPLLHVLELISFF